MENFKELKSLIVKNTIRTIQLEINRAAIKGLIISEEIMNEILADVEKNNA